MSDNEQWYDEEIAPTLLALAERCKERGMSFISSVEFDQGKRGGTYQIAEKAGLEMKMLWMCALSGCNVDGYMISLLKYCNEKSIDTSGSIFMQRFSEPQKEV